MSNTSKVRSQSASSNPDDSPFATKPEGWSDAWEYTSGASKDKKPPDPDHPPGGNVHLDAALLWLAGGYSTLPPREDGSKAPIADVQVDGEWTWSPYQTTPATEAHVREWYANGRTGVGVAGGVGGLEPFDFDDHATYEQFKEAAIALGYGDLVERIEAGYLEESPRGVHWMYTCDEVRPPAKLAERPVPDKPHGRKTLIETKGLGGFIIVAPSNGNVHPDGGAYRLLRGGPGTIAAIASAERDTLWDLARSFDEIPEAQPQPAEPKAKGSQAEDIRPGDAYAAENKWEDLLEPRGWVKVYTRGDVIYWRRPDKDRGVSATTGHCKGLYVFTTSTDFTPRRSYTKFGAYALTAHGINHDGDYSPAVRELAKLGYGQQKPKTPTGKIGTAAGPVTPQGVTPVAFYDAQATSDVGEWAEDVKDEPVEWIDENRLAAGKLHITAGAGGLGKSQTIIAKVAAVTTGGTFPDGTQCLKSGVVIILAAEDGKHDTIKPRLRAAGADMTKVFFPKNLITIPQEGNRPPLIDFVNFQYLAYWESLFKRLKPVLLVADPVPAFMGRDVNDHRNADVRRVLEPFADLLERYRVAMEASTHVGKSIKDKNAVDQLLGSVAYANLARRVDVHWLDPKTPGRFIITNPKLTLGPTQPAIAYTIEGFTYEKDGRTIATSRVKFEAQTFDADEYELRQGQKDAGRKKPRGPAPIAMDALTRFLFTTLYQKGPVLLGAIAQAAGEAGLLGVQVLDKETGREKWTKFGKLYEAIEKIPDLPPPDDGWIVVTPKDDPSLRSIKNHARWQLRRADSPF